MPSPSRHGRPHRARGTPGRVTGVDPGTDQGRHGRDQSRQSRPWTHSERRLRPLKGAAMNVEDEVAVVAGSASGIAPIGDRRGRLLRFGALIAAALVLSLSAFSTSARAAESDPTVVLAHGAFASPAG